MKPKYKSVTAYAPATIANVGCGFDIIGCAIEKPGDEVTVKYAPERSKLGFRIVGNAKQQLPKDIEKNCCSASIRRFLEDLGIPENFNILLKKNMPLGSGLGSSAASSVAGLVAMNHMLGDPSSRKDLLPYAMEAEKIASGSPHADNVAPSLLGGFVLIRSYEPLEVISLGTPKDLWASVIHPHIQIHTEDARAVLLKSVPLGKAISQWGNTAGLVAGILKADLGLIGRSINDQIIEPVRSELIPNFNEIKKGALESGALGFSLSGSGPSVFAFAKSELEANAISKGVVSIWRKQKISCTPYLSKINPKGAIILTAKVL